MRLLFTLCALFALGATAKADETPKFFLNPDGSVEQRLAGVESKTAALERRVKELEAKLAEPKAAVATAAPKAAPKKILFQTCVNGRCTNGECDDISQVPFGATVLAITATGCPTGPCGDACACTSGGFGATSAGNSCASGQCGSGRSGWYLGKRLGR